MKPRRYDPRKRSLGPKEVSSSVLARSLPLDCTEEKLSSIVFKNCGILPIFVKVVRDHQTHESKGYGYIDFSDIESSKTFMEVTGGSIFIEEYKIDLRYSNNPNQENKDWVCEVCKSQNFGFRLRCYNCSNPKTSTCEELDEKISRGPGASRNRVPTCELLIRGLSPITKEETVHRVFHVISKVVHVRIIRDHITLQSKCYGFVEFSSVEDATKALKAVDNSGVLIDGVVLRGEYAKRQHLVGREMKSYYPSSYVHYEYSKPSEDELDDRNVAVRAAKIRQRAEAEGFSYDLSSGYYLNKLTGVYFDPKTGYYYNTEKGGWVKLDEKTGEFSLVTEDTLKKEQVKESNVVEKVSVKKDSFGFGEIGLLGDVSFPSEEKKESDKKKTFDPFNLLSKNESIIETQTIGHEFTPNPKFTEVLQKVEIKESDRELQKLQKKVNKIKATKKRKRIASFPEQTKKENVGEKIMKRMGWKEGHGLGKNEDGMKSSISVTVRDVRRGLGFGNSSSVSVRDSKKIANKKKTLSRFNSLNK